MYHELVLSLHDRQNPRTHSPVRIKRVGTSLDAFRDSRSVPTLIFLDLVPATAPAILRRLRYPHNVEQRGGTINQTQRRLELPALGALRHSHHQRNPPQFLTELHRGLEPPPMLQKFSPE